MNAAPRANPSTLLAPGAVVAGHRIEGMLGYGGMGVVYEAIQLSLNRVIALKLLAAHLSEDAVFRERFRREGLLQARLDHPHIVTVHEAGESEYGLYLAMRLVRGPRLKDLVLGGELEARRTLALLEPIADALESAHAAGLVHRDVKPQNILIGAHDHPYLSDFGLTKLTGEHSLTESGEFVGTLDYISPEQIVGGRPTARSDVYSFGAMLYECLAGAVPYPGENQAAVLYGHLCGSPPRVTDRNPSLPATLDAVVSRSLAKDPSDRHESATELMQETRRAFGSSVPAIRPPPKDVIDDRTARFGPGARGLKWQAEPFPQATARTTSPDRPLTRIDRHAVVAVVVALAAVIAGLLAGGAGGTRTVASQAAAGRVELTWPAGWTRVTGMQPVAGIHFTNPAELRSSRDRRDGIVAGHTSHVNPILLPAAFVRHLRRPPSAGVTVDLGGVQARRYSNLALRGSKRRLTVYVAPDARGVATVACFAGSEAAEFLPSCERVAATLRLPGTRTYPVAPSARYVRSLRAIVGPLAASERVGRRRLGTAHGPNGQARSAVQLSRTYAHAARAVAAIHAPVAAHRVHSVLRSALARCETSYAVMADAIVSSDPHRYGRAVRSVRGCEEAFGGALADLHTLGYLHL